MKGQDTELYDFKKTRREDRIHLRWHVCDVFTHFNSSRSSSAFGFRRLYSILARVFERRSKRKEGDK